MPLSVSQRRDRGGRLIITGYIKLPDGVRVRYRRRAQSDQLDLAREEAKLLEARFLREAWHGPREAQGHTFAGAVISYIKAAPRATGDLRRLDRILWALGDDIPLAKVNQEMIDLLRERVLAPGAAPATIRRGIIVPVRAVMTHAARRGWCQVPIFESVREGPGRTRFFLPAEAERLLEAAAPHLRPLLLFLLGTGARLSEALELQWRDVDLADGDGSGRAILWRTKGGRRRDVELPPRAVAALAALPEREGPVFRYRGQGYADRERLGGGQIKKAWRGAITRAGLDTAYSPHDLRHTWASWHYGLHKDLLRLKNEGGWSDLALVERYAHLLPSGAAAAIDRFWQMPAHQQQQAGRRAAGS